MTKWQILFMATLFAVGANSFAMVTDESIAVDEFSHALKKSNIDVSELKVYKAPKGLVAMQGTLKSLGFQEQDGRQYIVTFRLGSVLIRCHGIIAERDLKQSTLLNECSAQTGQTPGVFELIN